MKLDQDCMNCILIFKKISLNFLELVKLEKPFLPEIHTYALRGKGGSGEEASPNSHMHVTQINTSDLV